MKVRDLIKFLADQPSDYDVVFPSKISKNHIFNWVIEEVPIKRALRVNFQRFIILRQENR
jgi:hypothetical protein